MSRLMRLAAAAAFAAASFFGLDALSKIEKSSMPGAAECAASLCLVLIF